MVKPFLRIIKNRRGGREGVRLFYQKGSGELQELVVIADTSDFTVRVVTKTLFLELTYSDAETIDSDDVYVETTGSAHKLVIRKVKIDEYLEVTALSSAPFTVTMCMVKGFINQ